MAKFPPTTEESGRSKSMPTTASSPSSSSAPTADISVPASPETTAAPIPAPEVAAPSPDPTLPAPTVENSTPVEPLPVAKITEVPPEPEPLPGLPPPGEAVAAIDQADAEAQEAQAKAEKVARANSPIPPPPPASPLRSKQVDSPGRANRGESVAGGQWWVCVTPEGPRTQIRTGFDADGKPILKTCRPFLVERIPENGKLIACPTCDGWSVRRADEAEYEREVVPALAAV